MTAQIQASNLANVFRSLARTPYVPRRSCYKLRDSARRKLRRAHDRRRAQAVVRARSRACWPRRSEALSAVTLSLRRAGAADRRQRLRAGGRLHASWKPSRAPPLRYQRPVHARPLQPLLDRAAARARHAAACACASISTGRARRAPPSAASESGTGRRRARHSALRNSATSVSARIFMSRPSDQWAM